MNKWSKLRLLLNINLLYYFFYLLEQFFVFLRNFREGTETLMSVSGLCDTSVLDGGDCGGSCVTWVSRSCKIVVLCELVLLSGSTTSCATVLCHFFPWTTAGWEHKRPCAWGSVSICGSCSAGPASLHSSRLLLLLGLGERHSKRSPCVCSSLSHSSSRIEQVILSDLRCNTLKAASKLVFVIILCLLGRNRRTSVLNIDVIESKEGQISEKYQNKSYFF